MLQDNNKAIRLFDEIKNNKDTFKVIKEYLSYKYMDILETIVDNNDDTRDALLKGEARAYKEIVNLLS